MVSSLIFIGIGIGIIAGFSLYWYIKSTIDEMWEWLEHEGML